MAEEKSTTAAPAAEPAPAPQSGYGSGYGKKPMWFWVVLYLVIGLVVYYAAYAIFFKKDSGSLYGGSGSSSSGSLYGN